MASPPTTPTKPVVLHHVKGRHRIHKQSKMPKIRKFQKQIEAKKLEAWYAFKTGPSGIERLPTELRMTIFKYVLPPKTKAFKPTFQRRKSNANQGYFGDLLPLVRYDESRAWMNGGIVPDSLTSFIGSDMPQPSTPHNNRTISYDEGTPRHHRTPSHHKRKRDGSPDSLAYAPHWPYSGGSPKKRAISLNTVSHSSPCNATSSRSFSTSISRIATSNNYAISRPSTSILDNSSSTFQLAAHAAQSPEVFFRLNPHNMFIPLMLTCRKFCSEVSTILYEEYIFELHIHEDGLDFLDLPRLNILENHGLLENVLCEETTFKDAGVFSFRRIKHLRFVLHGGDPKDRTAGMRMRQIIAKLVELFDKEEKPLTSVVVDFALDASKGAIDKKGTFWTDNDSESGRRSIWDSVSNIELITSPLLSLRNVSGSVILRIPVEITSAGDLAYKHAFEHTLMQSADYIGEGQFKTEVNNAIMEAVMSFELRKGATPVDKPSTAFVPLLKEEDFLSEVDETELDFGNDDE